jgi:hypothetical protein
MAWGIGWGLLIVGLVFAFIAYVLVQETRTHRFWRRKVQEGDLEMISQLVQAEVARWRTERPPKGTPASVWQGIQGVELVEIGRDYIRASTTAEPQFALVGSARRQVSSALDEAKRITVNLAERLFYDIAHVQPDRVQIDCYTTFHQPSGEATQRCILTTLGNRAAAAEVDWESDPPEIIVALLGGRYDVDGQGVALPIDPEEEAARLSENGSRQDESTDGVETVF